MSWWNLRRDTTRLGTRKSARHDQFYGKVCRFSPHSVSFTPDPFCTFPFSSPDYLSIDPNTRRWATRGSVALDVNCRGRPDVQAIAGSSTYELTLGVLIFPDNRPFIRSCRKFQSAYANKEEEESTRHTKSAIGCSTAQLRVMYGAETTKPG